MQRRSNIQISSLIIFLSILSIIIQFSTYYFFASPYLILGISCVISFICCHILLEQTTTYEACFQFSLLTLFISMVIVLLTYLQNSDNFLPYTSTMLGLVVINWLIPMLHCFFRNMLDYGTKVEDFYIFYRDSSILFFLIYIVVLGYWSFGEHAFLWSYQGTLPSINVVPFEVIATQIEEYLYGLVPLNNIVMYLLSRIIAFIPYGYFIALLMRRQNRLPRYASLLLLPFILEVLQYFIIPARCDIDDLIYAFLGGILGSVLFYLLNLIFHAITGKEFLMKDSDYRYSYGSLHF